MKTIVILAIISNVLQFDPTEASKVEPIYNGPPNITKPTTCACADDPYLEMQETCLHALKISICKSIWKKYPLDLKGPGIKMKNTLLKMLKSDSSIWSDTSSVNIMFLANYLPNINKKPNLCAYAQLINATVAWEKAKDSKAMSDAFDQIKLTIMEYVIATGNNAIKNAGCTALITKFSNNSCYNNGTIYLIDEMWEINEGIMPCAYPKAAKMLYTSTTYQDQLLAAMATVSQSIPLQEFALNFNPHLFYQWLQYTNASPIPPCCCKSYIDKINKIYPAFQHEIKRLFYKIKSKYARGWEKNPNNCGFNFKDNGEA